MSDYPWYALVNGDLLEQGDILFRCPVFLPPASLQLGGVESREASVDFEWMERDVVVLSQTCDLVAKRERVAEVLLCAIWSCNEVGGHLATAKGKEDARRGNLPSYHMLAPCELPAFRSDVRVVDFRRVYSLPLE